jgi:hypothetical protein
VGVNGNKFYANLFIFSCGDNSHWRDGAYDDFILEGGHWATLHWIEPWQGPLLLMRLQ